MPTVKSYTQQNTTPAAPTPRRSGYAIPQLRAPLRTAIPSAESFGSGFGQTVAQIGQQLFQDEIAKQDQIRLTKAENDLSAFMIPALYDPKSGALNLQGQDAFGAPDRFGEAYDKTVGTIRQGLSNDRQRFRFDQVSTARRQQSLQQLDVHVAQQSRQVDNDETTAKIANETQLSILATDPADKAMHLDEIRNAGAGIGQRNGWGAEKTRLFIETAISQAHVAQVHEYLAKGSDTMARAYFTTAEKEIQRGPARDQLVDAMEEGTLRGDAQRHTAAILAKHVDERQALDAAREIADPKLQDEVVRRVRDRFAENGRLEEAQLNRDFETAINVIEDGMSPQSGLGADQAIDRIAPKVWNRFSANQKVAARRYAAGLANGPIQTDRTAWYGLLREAANDPKAFVKRNLIEEKWQLSESDFQEIAKLQNSVQAGNAKEADKVLNGIRSNERIITSALRAAGIDPDDKKNKPLVDQMWKSVDEAVQALQQNTGKAATDEDIQKIVDDRLIEEGGKKGSWLNIFPGGEPFFDVPGTRKFQKPQGTPAPRTTAAPTRTGEPSATNPKTGERLVFRGGAWVKP